MPNIVIDLLVLIYRSIIYIFRRI